MLGNKENAQKIDNAKTGHLVRVILQQNYRRLKKVEFLCYPKHW